MSDTSVYDPEIHSVKLSFSLLFDEFYLGQDVNGPFDTIDCLATAPVPFLNRILSRKPSRYLQNASSCNQTFYPVFYDPESENAADDYQSALDEFLCHCR